MGLFQFATKLLRHVGPQDKGVQTGPQTGQKLGMAGVKQIVNAFGGKGSPLPAGDYDTYRKMIRHPTIALMRAAVMGPIVASKWSYESKDGTPPDRVKFIQDQIDPFRDDIVKNSLTALDFGWQPFELGYDIRGGQAVVSRVKPLLQDISEFVIDEVTGDPVGIKNGDVELDMKKCLVFAVDVESVKSPYGCPRLENIRELAWMPWIDCNNGAASYDRKVAGVMFILRYAPGLINLPGGATIDAYTIASQIADAVKSGNGCTWPDSSLGSDDRSQGSEFGGQFVPTLLEDKGSRQPGFKDRLQYLDSLICRGYGRPERSVLESTTGGIGTSDTSDMQDLGLTDAELLHGGITQDVNRQVIDNLLVFNFGPAAKGSVFLTPAPIIDRKIREYAEIIKSIAAQPGGIDLLLSWFDMDVMIDALGYPKQHDIMGPQQLPPQESQLPPEPGSFKGPQAEAARKVAAMLSRGMDQTTV